MKLVYFAWIRQRIGKSEEDIDLPSGVTTVADLIAHLRDRGEPYASVLEDEKTLKAAIDQEYVDLAAALGNAREVALFPPVTGG